MLILSYRLLEMNIVLEKNVINLNETAGHNRHVYRPLTLLKIPFRRWKAFFFSKSYYIQQNLIVFEIHFFLNSSKNLQFMWKKKHFHEIVSFDSYSTATFLPSPLLKKSIFEKKPSFFSQKKTISNAFQKFSDFSRILRQNCYDLMIKNFQKFKTVKHRTFLTPDIISWQVSVKNIRVE